MKTIVQFDLSIWDNKLIVLINKYNSLKNLYHIMHQTAI